MPRSSKNQNDHSTLELVAHDEAVRAPEHDIAATAFELDTTCLAPEVSPGVN